MQNPLLLQYLEDCNLHLATPFFELWLPKEDAQGLLHSFLWKHLKLAQKILSRKEIPFKKASQLLYQVILVIYMILILKLQ
jgi:hypothetical protein